MRVLITGASGFVGAHLAQACAQSDETVVGLSLSGALPTGCGQSLLVDLRGREAARAAVREARPDVIYHLAALSSVGRSWQDPAETMSDNVAVSAAVLEAIRHEAPDARIVWVSSCDVYGQPESLPVDETARLQPANPYAVSKAAGDFLAGVYAQAHSLSLIRVRPFNHAGPGQLPGFVISSIARQAAEARLKGATRLRIVVGNPETRRDFTDVRDVVRAYRLLAEHAEPDIYHVSSGRSYSTLEQLELVGELLAPLPVEHEVDPSRMRANEVMDLRGSHERLTAATGWVPEIPLRKTLADTIAWWERELSDSGAAQH